MHLHLMLDLLADAFYALAVGLVVVELLAVIVVVVGR